MAGKSRTDVGDDIARCVLEAYDRLPQKSKPLAREPGCREWVPLSGIVLAKHCNKSDDDETKETRTLECVALGTGMKCLPVSKLPIARGNVLHDTHAEIVAVRAFNRFLLDQCLVLARDTAATSAYLRRRQPHELTSVAPQPFSIYEDVAIHMYGSEAPCGDASMELTMAAQEDSTPWDVVPATDDSETVLRGRGSFAELGIVRRKPARPDAPPTLSKSCTDKLTLYQFICVLNSMTSCLISPENAYLSTLTIPASQYVPAAVKRAFSASGRLSKWEMDEESPHPLRSFAVQTTDREFSWSRRAVSKDDKAISSNISAVYTPSCSETLINGVLQGRKIGDAKGASQLCRKSLWKTAMQVAILVDGHELRDALSTDTYQEFKANKLLKARRDFKNHVLSSVLPGWIRNEGDDDFSLN